MTPAGFPHSDISGSMPVSGSPKLFAAYHVLHRLSLPRHPPYALTSLTIKYFTISPTLRTTHLHEFFSRFGAYCLPHYTLCNCQRTVIQFEVHRILGVIESLELSSTCFLNSTNSMNSLTHNSLVEVNGFEPMTSCVQGRRSPS